MELISTVNPFVRVAHHYLFPHNRNTNEESRIGYCYAFHLVDGGKGKVSAAGRSYSIKKGDLLYFPPMVNHSFFSDADQPLSTYNMYCELWGNEPMPTSHHLAWSEDEFNPDLLTEMKPCRELDELTVVIPLQHHNDLLSLFTQAIEKHQRKDMYADLIVHSLLKAFLMLLVQTAPFQQPVDYRIMSIIERMDKDVKNSSGYEHWLEESGLQKSQFHDLFKQTTGMSPKAYKSEKMMKQAQASLLESNRSITDIANDLGFSSIHHFTKQFKLYHGVSPLDFRRKRMFTDTP